MSTHTQYRRQSTYTNKLGKLIVQEIYLSTENIGLVYTFTKKYPQISLANRNNSTIICCKIAY